MSIKKLQKINFTEVIERLKKIIGKEDDAKVAEMLGIKQAAFANRKRRNSIPYEEIITFCNKEDISIDLVFRGDEKTLHTAKQIMTELQGTDHTMARVLDDLIDIMLRKRMIEESDLNIFSQEILSRRKILRTRVKK